MKTALPMMLVAACVTFAVTPLCRWLALRLGIVDQPGGRKQHGESVPLLGGLAVFSGLLVVWYASYGLPTGIADALLLVSVPTALVVGVWDDIHDLKTHIKVGWELVVVGLAAASIAVEVPELTVAQVVRLSLCGVFLLGSMNLINFADTYDGLCALTCAGIAVASALAQGGTPAHWAVVGACIGFIPWNFSRRHRIFLGDGGSLMLGLLVGYLVLEPVRQPGRPGDEVLPLLLMGVPILDGAVVTLHRFLAGRPVTVGARDHLSHRLVTHGIPPRAMVWLLAAVSAAFASLAIPYSGATVAGRALVLAAALTLWAVGLVWALQSPVYDRE